MDNPIVRAIVFIGVAAMLTGGSMLLILWATDETGSMQSHPIAQGLLIAGLIISAIYGVMDEILSPRRRGQDQTIRNWRQSQHPED